RSLFQALHGLVQPLPGFVRMAQAMMGQGQHEPIHAGLLVPGGVHPPGFFKPRDRFLVLFGTIMCQAESMEIPGISILADALLHETYRNDRVRNSARSQAANADDEISGNWFRIFAEPR